MAAPPVALAPAASESMRSLADLTRDIDDAMRKMSAHNPHREVLAQCQAALADVAVQLRQQTEKTAALRRQCENLRVDMQMFLGGERHMGGLVAIVEQGTDDAVRAWLEALVAAEDASR